MLLDTQHDPVQLRVTDTGSGIHPDDLPYIFERYYQSRRLNALLQVGTGIGLSLYRDYCRLWQGELTVETQWGQGSTFAFTYPRVWAGAGGTSIAAEPEGSTELTGCADLTLTVDPGRDLGG